MHNFRYWWRYFNIRYEDFIWGILIFFVSEPQYNGSITGGTLAAYDTTNKLKISQDDIEAGIVQRVITSTFTCIFICVDDMYIEVNRWFLADGTNRSNIYMRKVTFFHQGYFIWLCIWKFTLCKPVCSFFALHSWSYTVRRLFYRNSAMIVESISPHVFSYHWPVKIDVIDLKGHKIFIVSRCTKMYFNTCIP